MDLADHPLIVPPGHRIVRRFARMPIEIAGREYWLETYRVVQRHERHEGWLWWYEVWVDVGYWDEVMPVKAGWPGE